MNVTDLFRKQWFFVLSRQSLFRLWFLIIHFLCFMKITFSPWIFSMRSHLVKCAKKAFILWRWFIIVRCAVTQWIPGPAALFDLRFNMHLAISHESAKYWLLLCYKCSIHCRATHLHCRKPMKYFWEKFHYTNLRILVTWQLNSVWDHFLRQMRRKWLWHFYFVCTGKRRYREPKDSLACVLLLYDSPLIAPF